MATYSMVDLLTAARECGASDLHLIPGKVPTYGVNGELHPVQSEAVLTQEDVAELANGITPEHAQIEIREAGSTDFSFTHNDMTYRVNVAKERKGLTITIRPIPDRIRTPEEIGLAQVVLDLCDRPRGLVLVTGCTGSGKSTTLASIVDSILKRSGKKVITVEQPIEYIFRHGARSIVAQHEVPIHAASFANALRAMLRQAPNVIMVGELRDYPTMDVALSAAETGHLVLGTLHTNSAPDSVDRFVNVFPTDQQNAVRTVLAEVLLGIMSQQLVLSADHRGRVLAYELMVNEPGVANLIRKGEPVRLKSQMQLGAKYGSQILDDHLFRLIQSGAVDPESAIAKAHHPQELRARLKL